MTTYSDLLKYINRLRPQLGRLRDNKEIAKLLDISKRLYAQSDYEPLKSRLDLIYYSFKREAILEKCLYTPQPYLWEDHGNVIFIELHKYYFSFIEYLLQNDIGESRRNLVIFYNRFDWAKLDSYDEVEKMTYKTVLTELHARMAEWKKEKM